MQRNFNVGSEAYNAPELWIIEEKECELLQNQSSSPSRRCENRLYDAVKSDIFSAAVTLFVMSLKFSPFRRAVPQDPHYKRLAGNEKHRFWKIYGNQKTSGAFKDLFEKISSFNPGSRLSIDQILQHHFVLQKDGAHASPEIQKEIQNSYANVQKLLGDEPSPFKDDYHSSHSIQSDSDIEDEEQRFSQDNERFEQLRQTLINEVFQISL